MITLDVYARALGTRLDELAADLRGHAMLAATYSPRAAHAGLLAAAREGAAKAARAWDAACVAEVGIDRRRVLPDWPRWKDTYRRAPVEIAWLTETTEDAAAIDALADECRRWAREWVAQQEPRQGAA